MSDRDPSSLAASSAASLGAAPGISGFIVVDQFGYLPDAKKVAVIRDPQTGYDAALSFTPGATYQLINLDTGAVALSGTATSWKSGAIFLAAGDKAWWFDFSALKNEGKYYVLDVDSNRRSFEFEIRQNI